MGFIIGFLVGLLGLGFRIAQHKNSCQVACSEQPCNHPPASCFKPCVAVGFSYFGKAVDF